MTKTTQAAERLRRYYALVALGLLLTGLGLHSWRRQVRHEGGGGAER